MICITCPMGCTLEVTHDGETVLEVDGNTCPRGLAYVEGEIKDPRRMVATTVQVKDGLHPLVPVYTEAPFPKPQIFELLSKLREVEIEAPVSINQVVLRDALGTGIDVIASREMPRRHEMPERIDSPHQPA
jgi:CxxC motif-containing protein